MRKPRIKLNDQERWQIALIYQAGYSARAIARVYGMDKGVVTRTLKKFGVKQRSLAERNRLYALNPRVFDRIDNEHAAYWWGLLYADGCVSRRSLVLALKWSDRDHVQRLGDFMQSESPIYKRYHPKNKNNARIEFTDEHLVKRMRELGIVARRTEAEAIWKHLPGHLIWHWIRGYFDGDGSARKTPSITFCGQESLMKWIREVAARDAGTNPNLSVRKHKTAEIYYLYFSGRLQALKIADCMYQSATVFLPRKKTMIDSWPQQRTRINPPQCHPGYVIKRKRAGGN